MSKTLYTKHDAIVSIIQQASPRQLQEKISTFHPSDFADVFMLLEERDREFVILSLNFHQLADLFTHLEPAFAAKQAALLNADKAAHVIGALSPDDAADILNAMSKSAKTAIYEHLEQEQVKTLQSLTTYKTNTAGALMTSDCVILPGEMTAAATLKQIAKATNPLETIHRIYVTGENRFLEGVVELRTLIEAEAQTTLRSLMHTDILTVQVEDRSDYVIQLIQNYQINQLPVVDQQFRLLGVITMDDAVGVLWRQSRRTYAVQGGLSPKMPLGVTLSRRLFWMSLLSGMALVLSYILHSADLTQATIMTLLLVWPLILGLTGQMMLQTQALTVQSLQSQKLPDRESKNRHVLKEWALNSLSGFMYSLLLMGLLTLAAMSLPFASLTIRFIVIAGMALSIGSSLSGLLGSLIPILFARFNLRPVWASGWLLGALMHIVLTLGLIGALSLWL